MGKNLKVILDTNVWISLFLQKALSQELKKIINRQATIYISKQILIEISKVLTYPKITRILAASEINAKHILRTIATNTTLVDPKIKVKLIDEDPEDDKILECALTVSADIIITGDTHLIKIGKFKQTKIISPREFLDYCSSN
jgi:putative PIN family toxin of toxin-antitoxin system